MLLDVSMLYLQHSSLCVSSPKSVRRRKLGYIALQFDVYNPYPRRGCGDDV